MKKIIVIVCVCFLTMNVSAQITWNAKGGIGAASAITSNGADAKLRIVGKIGAGIEVPLGHDFMLMPSLEAAWKGGKYKWNKAGYDGEENISTTYIQIPVLMAYRLNLSERWNMAIKAGPYFAYAVSGKDKQSFTYNGKRYSGNLDIFDSGEMGGKTAKRFDVGVDVGVDFEYHRFVIGLEYELGFISMAPNDGTLKNQALYLTVGYKF